MIRRRDVCSGQTPQQLRRSASDLTCRYDAVDAGHLLPADLVGRPAQQGPVVHLDLGLVAGRRGRPGLCDVLRLQLYALGRVIERPPELDLGRVGVDLAGYAGLLLLRHPVHRRLVGLARRGNCNEFLPEV